jgi:hypothetical protein
VNVSAIEARARMLCDAKYGEGHFDNASTHRNRWRAKARESLGDVAFDLPPQTRAAALWARFVRWMGVA